MPDLAKNLFPRILPVIHTLCLMMPPAIVRAEQDPVHTILFGSLDAGRSSFTSAGAKVGLAGHDREGIAVLVSLGGGVRRERGSGPASPVFLRATMLGSALAGYQMVRPWGVAALFAGPEATAEALAGIDAFQMLKPRVGLRLHGEVWARPSDDTLVTLTLILGSARSDAYGRASFGYRIWGAYLGPEAALYADRTGYLKWSVGVHATDFALGAVSFRVSAGLQGETGEDDPCGYLTLAAWTPL
ncbi:hypothetical protein LKMONMHP_3122 [Methylobacterium organophilum]|uniref:Cellulose biosynthesis protein BcsS n=1 Tax=Methylobacterium organophilum TaxID=410 RepID=A0ABQ4TDS3_METOR|nr:hypothetical protein LKMONMHP_3122 [Methylobacterium organophilum]